MGPATFLSGTQWKAWDGRLLVGVMAGERIAVLQLDPAGMTTATSNANLADSAKPLAGAGAGRESLRRDRWRRDLAGGAELGFAEFEASLLM